MDPEDVRELRDRACSVIGAFTAINLRITQDQVQQLVKYKNEEQHERYLDWLSSETFAADLGKPTYQPGTGKWFIESHEFQTWIQSRGQTLFCHGIPGAGKSSMASIIIDDLNHRHGNDSKVGIAHTFCSFRYCDDPRQSPENLLASLIRQLVWRLPQLPSTIQGLYEKHRGNGSRPSFNDLCKVFKEVVRLKQAFIVIDALDECKPATVSGIISQIFETQASGNLNFLATSRSVPAIQAEFIGRPFKEILAANDDVMEYLKAGLKDCEDCAVIRRPLLQQRAISVIADSGNAAVNDAYQNIVERINNQDPRRQRLAKDTLSWVICAKRPLTPLELRTALTIELGDSRLNDEDLYDLEDIISWCAGLITVGSDGTKEVVQLAHYTMHEYFTRHQTIFFPESDQTITASCLTYLSYNVFREGMCSNDIEFEDRLSQYPLVILLRRPELGPSCSSAFNSR
ncbi:hypothetical protein N7488_004682 [Penicillium malachiteum]|nr:hypothetical protein N7488_004682 [Penicillium malachiteum]